VVANGQARGILPAGHELLMTRARSAAFGEADLVIVVGTPLDFRLGYGEFGGRDGAPRALVVHVADAASQLATHVPLAASAAGDLAAFFTGLAGRAGRIEAAWAPDWLGRLREARDTALAADGPLMASDADPIHPMRIYGELARVLDDDAVVIGDGGDFVSYAGKVPRAAAARRLAGPGPVRLPGHRPGLRDRGPDRPPGRTRSCCCSATAPPHSLMDADTLVRHRLPVVMICGNNGAWGLEKHRCEALYGYDVAADLQPQCRYDQVVAALGGAGELVTRADGIVGAAPGVRLGRPVPGQHRHRPGRRLPALHHRGLSDHHINELTKKLP
jgi:acetolactate synthase-1/2/3 large subunit